MSVLVKTGLTQTAAIRAARCFTKNKILRYGYHGWHDWCVEVRRNSKIYSTRYLEFKYNDIGSVGKIVKENKNEIAAIITTQKPPGKKLKYQKKFLNDLREITKKHNIVLIFDEIRSGFRVNLGGAQKYFGVTPDLSTFGKAIANGYEIAALVGKTEIMKAYEKEAFISATYFENSLPIIAALETIKFLKKNNVIKDINKKGLFFQKKVEKILSNYHDICEFSGGPWMPYITFK